MEVSSGLPPQEAPIMIAEKRKLFFSFLFLSFLFFSSVSNGRDAFPEQIEQWGVQQDMANWAVIAAFMPFASLQSHLSQA